MEGPEALGEIQQKLLLTPFEPRNSAAFRGTQPEFPRPDEYAGRATEGALPLRIGGSAPRVDLLTRILGDLLSDAQPRLASTARAARFALDELRAMALSAACGQVHAPAPVDLEQLARASGLPEIEAVDFRRGAGQGLTVDEAEAWARIERFAALVAAAAGEPQHPFTPTSTAGAGPARAS